MPINSITWSVASAYDADNNLVTVTDSTTYPVASNLVYLPDFSFYKASSGDEDLVPTPDSGSDNLITSWTFTPDKDGVFRMNIIAAFTEATLIAENTNFQLGDVIVNGGNYYYYNNSTPSADDYATDPTKWTLLTSENFTNARFYTSVDTLITQNSEECLQEEQIKLARQFLADCGCDVDCSTVTKLEAWIESSKLLFADGDSVGAQQMIEKAIETCNCLI